MPLDVESLGPGDLLADKLRVVRRLGEGGMGAVFEVEHTMTRHRRALKVLHAHLATNGAVVQRFLREASAAGRIDNPHIAETFDAGQLATGELYLVMELLRGKTLTDHVASIRRALTLQELVDLLAQVCDGVAAAHAAGIVHRDLKPDNLFVVDRDGQPFVKILDFGISKFDEELPAGTPLTREGQMLGTPYYMSPEQFKGQKDVDLRADIYSLGVISYELAAGRRPYDGDTLPALLMAIVTAARRPLAELRPDLPDPFLRLVDRAMSPERAERQESAIVLARDLRGILEGGSRSPLAVPSDERQRPSFAATEALPPSVPPPPPSPRPAPVPSLVPLPPKPVSLAPTLDPLAASLAAPSPPPAPDDPRSPPASRLALAVLLGALGVAAVGASMARLSDRPSPARSGLVTASVSAVAALSTSAVPPSASASSTPADATSLRDPSPAPTAPSSLPSVSPPVPPAAGRSVGQPRSAAPAASPPAAPTPKTKPNGIVTKGDFDGNF